jgi:hypothetical protein
MNFIDMNNIAAIALLLGFFTTKAQTVPADLLIDPETKQAKCKRRKKR